VENNHQQILHQKMNKQILIDALSSVFIERCEHFINIGDYDTADALYAEYVVDNVDPEDGEYEWTFIPNLTLNK
jgi:hypothetical protein